MVVGTFSMVEVEPALYVGEFIQVLPSRYRLCKAILNPSTYMWLSPSITSWVRTCNTPAVYGLIGCLKLLMGFVYYWAL